jgi:hypothetical protein
LYDEGQRGSLTHTKNRRNGCDATDATVKPHAFAVVLRSIVLIFDWHPMAISRHLFGSSRRRNRHRNRRQSQRDQEYREEEVAEH